MQGWSAEKLQAHKAQIEELLKAATATGQESVDTTPLFAAEGDLKLINDALAGKPIPPDTAATAAVQEAEARISAVQKQRAKLGAEGTQLPQAQRPAAGPPEAPPVSPDRKAHV